MNAVGELTDIPVQKPVRSLSGDFIIRTSDGTLTSLLCWMDGVPFDSVKRSGQMLISAGRTLAELRKAEEAAAGLKAFHRLLYNRKLVEHLAVKAM